MCDKNVKSPELPYVATVVVSDRKIREHRARGDHLGE